jgi:myo-inositol-1(or 4)-monophosphatase
MRSGEGSAHYLETARALAASAGDVMRKNFALSMKKEWKADHSPVTETDLAINDLVLKELAKRYPDHDVLSEEGDNFSNKSDYVWICDPVDGTHNFSHGIPTATFALALTHAGKPLVSVVYDPFLDRLYAAEKGKGATLNGKPIRVSESPLLKRTVVGMGKMKDTRNLIATMEVLREYGPRIITGLSVHYMCALVAAGEFSAAFFGGTSPHDITASALLVEEAGGKASDLFGETPARYDREIDGQLFTNRAVHDELLRVMDKAEGK